MSSREPCEGGAGSTLDVIDAFCKVTTVLVDIIRSQEIMIQQAEISGIMFDNDYAEKKEETMKELDSLERRIKRL